MCAVESHIANAEGGRCAPWPEHVRLDSGCIMEEGRLQTESGRRAGAARVPTHRRPLAPDRPIVEDHLPFPGGAPPASENRYDPDIPPEVGFRARGTVSQAAEGELADQFVFRCRGFPDGRVDPAVPVFFADAFGAHEYHRGFAGPVVSQAPRLPFVGVLVAVHRMFKALGRNGAFILQQDSLCKRVPEAPGVPPSSVQGR